ncbi:MAG: protein kinase domain-containing protein [Acidobacteriota bacterium]
MAIPLAYIEGKYEILEKLSEGGMGAIYKVRHRLLDAIRVIKVMHPQHEQDESLRARFLREARLAVKMRHPNIAQMYDFAVDEHGNAFIVMEFIDGITLQELLERTGPPAIGLSLGLAIQSLKAVGYLHKKGIVHRDIAPDNIMVTRDEEGEPQVKLIDLGIAKWLEGEMGLTGTGMFLGKLRYASPEQFQARETAPLDQRSDLYSFGLVLYELLTGKHPIAGSTPPTLIAGHLLHPPTDFATTDPEGRVPDDLRAAVMRSLAKLPEGRFSTAAEFARALAEIQARFIVTADDFERAMTMPAMPTQKIQVPAPGSTQDRLDRQFKMMSTPAPDSSLTGLPRVPGTPAPPGPASPPTEALGGQARALLLGAEKLASLRHFDEARLQLQAALEIEPGNQQARRLLADVEAALDRGSTIPGRETTAIRALAAAVAGELEQGALDEAASRLDDGERIHGTVPEFEELRARLGELFAARERTRRARVLADEAGDLLRRGLAAEALAAVLEASSLTLEDESLAGLQAAAEDAVRAADEARRRDDAIARAAAEVSALLDSRNLVRAAQQLARSSKKWGDVPAFVELGERLTLAQAEERSARVEELLAEATACLEQGRHQVALAKLEQALGIDPSHSRAQALLAEAGEAARRAESIKSVTREVGELIDGGRLDEAEAMLRTARAELGEAKPLVAQQGRLDGAREKLVHARVTDLLGQARELAGREAFDQAMATLDEAGVVAPADPRIERVRNDVREAQGRHQAELARQAAIVVAIREIEAVAATGDFALALERIEEETERLGEAEVFITERRRLEELQRRRRRAELAALQEGARALADSGGFEDALDLLRRARAVAVEKAEQDEVDSARARVESQAEQQHHEQKIAHAVDSIGRCLARGDLAEAEREMALAERLYGQEASLVSLRGRLTRLRHAQAKARGESAIASARRLAETGRLDQGVAELRSAAALDPDNEPLKQALAELERRQAEAAVEALLAAGDSRGAERALGVAEKLFGRAGRLSELRERVAAALHDGENG